MTNLMLLVSIIFVACSVNIVHSTDFLRRNGRENSIDLCDVMQFSDTNKVQCYCKNMLVGTTAFVFKADCILNQNNIPTDDDVWRAFSSINSLERLTISSKGDSVITYVPTLALKSLHELLVVSILHGKIEIVHPYAFANLTYVQEIKLSGNEIHTLAYNAFAHHPNLTSITLDKNRITEIKRNVFRKLPQIQELFLTSNNISIIHDRAFLHVGNLKSLELDKNSIFVLTNETFLGLMNVERLELGDNHLEVIGDNTFTALTNLRSLNLANNKIKMLDDNAFQGATKLQSLSLAHNKLRELRNPRVFAGLKSLVVLDLKANAMKFLSVDSIAPIMHNFYSIGSSLGFEDNEFPCDCKLNWFVSLKNRTKNSHLQDTIDNLMCYPSAKLAEDYKKYDETDSLKSDEVRNPNENTEVDYYDETSMGGKLFFSDIPENMLPCDDTTHTTVTIVYPEPPQISSTEMTPTRTGKPHRSTSHTRIETKPSPGQETTTTIRLPILRDLHPTEDVVKDAFETVATRFETTTHGVSRITQDSEKGHRSSTSITRLTSADTQHNDDNMKSRDIIQGDEDRSNNKITQTSRTDQTPAPESMSHVNSVSKASFLHSKILPFVITTCVFLTSVRFKL